MSQKSPNSLHELFIVKIKALYDVENQLVKALPDMAEAATDPELKQGFKDHLKETENHVKRLDEVFKFLEVAAAPETSDAIRGHVSDAKWCIDNIEKGPVLDAALVSAGQSVEHFEIAAYGTAREWAKTMGHSEIVDLLEQTEQEEKTADEKLNNLALSKINQEANTMEVQGMDSEKGYAGKFQTGDIQ
jgi:ferritin-like metal-binding protein YciE